MSRTWWRLGAVATVALAASGCIRFNVEYLSSDALLGRNNDTPGSQDARDHIIDVLTGVGAQGAVVGPGGVRSFLQPFDVTLSNGNRAVGTNILGVIPGTTTPDEYVIVGAHYDHVVHCGIDPADTICNGATDNATGVAAVLEIAERISANPVERSVVFALWDAEEDGLVGSAQYVQHPVVPLADTVAYVNYDIAGANLRPSLRDTHFAIAAETGGAVLTDIVAAATDVGPADTVLLSSIFGQFRSDYASFVNVGVPTVFFSDSTGPCYHTPEDELGVVDFPKLRSEVAMGHEVTTALANADVAPTFAAGAPLITFADVVAIEGVTSRALVDSHLLDPTQQAQLASAHAVLLGVVQDGAANFTNADWGPVFNAVLTLVDLLTNGECDGYLTP